MSGQRIDKGLKITLDASHAQTALQRLNSAGLGSEALCAFFGTEDFGGMLFEVRGSIGFECGSVLMERSVLPSGRLGQLLAFLDETGIIAKEANDAEASL